MKRNGTLLLLIFFAVQTIYAQSTGREIETLLETRAVTYAQAARFVIQASPTAAALNQAEAFRYAQERGWLPKDAAADKAARLDGISKLILESFDIKGGIMYTLTKSPHYAYRELTYMNIIQGRTVGSMPVSGELLLFITGRLLTWEEGKEAADRRRQEAEEAARERREALAAQISTLLVRQRVSDTTVEVTDEGVTITLSNIQFLADSSVLHNSEMLKLQEIANILRDISGIKIQVSGHTAMAGTRENRLMISRERAQVVAAYLVSLGACEAGNITSIGYGGDRPIADNTTEAGMALNRRVEITILEN